MNEQLKVYTRTKQEKHERNFIKYQNKYVKLRKGSSISPVHSEGESDEYMLLHNRNPPVK